MTTPDAVKLSYALEPGTTFRYEVTLDQHIDMTTTGDPSAMGDEEIPGEMSLDVSGTTTFSHAVADGPEPGTFEVTITGDFTDLTFDGTIDGEPIDPTELPDMAEIEPVDVTVVVDEQGNIVRSDEDGMGDLFGGSGDLGGFGDLAAPGMDPGRFVGPSFADREVTVGDVWSETIRVPVPMVGNEIVTEIVSEVTGTETIDGAEVFVIETTSTTSMIEMDLAEFLIGFFEVFVSEDASDEDLAELESLKESLRFSFAVDESTTESTTWFDHAEGYSRKADYSGGMHMVVDINMPDETTGEMVEFGMEMTTDQSVSYRLLDATSA